MFRRAITLISALFLASCSSVHYTTDINKVRNVYNDRLEEMDDISSKRSTSISSINTPFSKKIECLSSQYSDFSVAYKESLVAAAKKSSRDFAKQIDATLQKLNKIENGGYEYIVTNTSGEPIKRKFFEEGLNDIAFEIKMLDIISSKNINTEREVSSQTFSLLDKFEQLNLDLQLLKKEKAELEKKLLSLRTQREKYIQIIVPSSAEVFDSSVIGTKFSVANIYDKTGEVYPGDSTAISNMVEHALTYNKAIAVVNTPHGESFNYSRYNPLHPLSNSKPFVDNDTKLLSDSYGFAGTLFPSDIFISGGLVQYDENVPIKPFATSFGADIDPLNFSSSTQAITIGLILNAVDSNNSIIMDNAELRSNERNNESSKSSVYLQNTFFVKKISADVFEIKSKRLYGGDITVEVADPVQYALREMVESATYQILKKTLPPKYQAEANQNCDHVT